VFRRQFRSLGVGGVWCHESVTQELQEEGRRVPKCQEGDLAQLQPDGAQLIASRTSEVDRVRCQ
jgi:hypothetical protein